MGDTYMIDWNKMTSAEFEELALAYAQSKYKEYAWNLTPPQNDDNHDFYYIEIDNNGFEWEGWGEAKHSGSTTKIMSREKWDQTIISGQLAKNVKHLIFVTNARIPFKYIFRAECLKTPPYEKFEYINNAVLEWWLYENPQFIPTCLKPFSLEYIKNREKSLKLNFYIVDYFSSSQSLLHEIYETYSNKDYLLLILIESNYKTNLNIHISPEESIQLFPYEIVDIDNIFIPVGIICIKYIVRFRDDGDISFKLHVNDLYSKKKSCICKKYFVHKNFIPKLIYNNQLKIIEELLEELQKNVSANRLFVLYAAKGVGKTYLLNTLLCKYKLYNQFLFLTFTESLEDCARNLCIIFLAINFGIDYSKENFWNEICKMYEKIPESNKPLMLSELQLIYEGTKKDNATSALLAIHYIQKYLLTDKISLLNSGCHKYLIIVCDDVHKIPKEYEVLMSTFIKNFCIESSFSSLLFAGRNNEFSCEMVYSEMKKNTYKSYILRMPSINECKSSLKLNFNFINDIVYYSGILAKCNSTFLLCVLLRKVKSFVEINGANEALLQIEISQIYKQICETDYQLERDEFNFYSDDFDIIFPIYAYQSGLSINLFKQDTSRALERIYKLFDAGIIDIQNDYLLPSHDIYKNIFLKLCRSSEYKNINKTTAEFFFKNLDNPYIDIYRVLPLLLILNPENKNLYLEKGILSLNEYYKRTEYGKMSLLCEKIIKVKYPNINESLWTKEKLWLFYLYADCLDHCGSLSESKEYFSLVYDHGFSQMEDDTLDFLWDAKAQIFNIQYYLLEIKDVIPEINTFLYENNFKIKREHSIAFEVAYLNALNRRMMIALLCDEYKIGTDISDRYYKLASELGNKSHQAYYYIDYARGIYQQNPYRAISLMKEAYERFKIIPSEKRRLIDTESELRYLECLLENKQIKYLDEVSESIASSGYTHIYANSLLKRTAIRIYNRDLTIARNLLLKVSLILELKDFPRTRLLFSNLMAAICFLEKDDNTALQHIKIQNSLASTIGNSYQISMPKSTLMDRKVDFNFRKCTDAFPLEVRLW